MLLLRRGFLKLKHRPSMLIFNKKFHWIRRLIISNFCKWWPNIWDVWKSVWCQGENEILRELFSSEMEVGPPPPLPTLLRNSRWFLCPEQLKILCRLYLNQRFCCYLNRAIILYQKIFVKFDKSNLPCPGKIQLNKSKTVTVINIILFIKNYFLIFFAPLSQFCKNTHWELIWSANNFFSFSVKSNETKNLEKLSFLKENYAGSHIWFCELYWLDFLFSLSIF